MAKEKVSIIIPVYNSEKYIKECINSAINQDYENIEIVIVNDGSKDSSENIIRKYNNPNIRLINQKNQGPSAARNKGIKNSTGDWILFLDSDDMLAPNAVSTLVKYSDKADFVTAGWNGIYPNTIKYFGPEKNNILIEKEIQDLSDYLLSCRAINKSEKTSIGSIEGPVAKLYSSKIIKENNITFPEELKYAEDVCFNYSYLQFCTRIKTINKAVYFASRHNDSLSNSQKRLMTNKECFLKEIEQRNFNNWPTENSISYRFLYWTLEDIYSSLSKGYNSFKIELSKAKGLNFNINKKYLTKWKKVEIFFLKLPTFSSFLLFKMLKIAKKLRNRMIYGK